MKPNFCLIMTGVMLSAALHLGAILKKEDHIAQTQTDPILYEKKMEELKDGEKGPSMPKIEYYKKAGFLTTAPVAGQEETAMTGGPEQPYELQEGLPEEVRGEKAEPSSDEYWWIEEGGDSGDREATAVGETNGQAKKAEGAGEKGLKESSEGDDWLD